MGVHADSPGPNCSRSPLSTFEDGGGTNTMRSSDAKPNQIAFAGRLGANQAFILEPGSSVDISTIKRIPDASPFMSWQEQVDLRGFRQIELWRAGLVEGVGSLLATYMSMYWASSVASLPAPFSERFGPYNNSAFIGTVVGGVLSWAFVTLFILSFSPVSGGHLNPTITMGTFFGRLCSLPRMVIYVGFQTLGTTLAGLLLRKGLGSREFKIGGCWLDQERVPVSDAFVTEFMACLVLIFIAFGVGLDPRQSKVVGPSLSPVLIGLVFAALSIGTGFSRYGYGGTSMNPARCFGAYVGSEFPSWHWYQWVAPISATFAHGIFYYFIPPWK